MTMLSEAPRFQQFTTPAMEPIIAVLTSWKDIAHYVGKGVRTVQRWERDLGLPVRRPKRARKSPVLAVPAEIDAWVRSHQFPDGQLSAADAERTGLLRSIRALQAENCELRRQLDLERSKCA